MEYCIGRAKNYLLIIDLDNLSWQIRPLKDAPKSIKDKKILRKDYERNYSLYPCRLKADYPYSASGDVSPSKTITISHMRGWIEQGYKNMGFAYYDGLIGTGNWCPLYVRSFDDFLLDCKDYPDLTPYVVLYEADKVYDIFIYAITSLTSIKEVGTWRKIQTNWV